MFWLVKPVLWIYGMMLLQIVGFIFILELFIGKKSALYSKFLRLIWKLKLLKMHEIWEINDFDLLWQEIDQTSWGVSNKNI